MKNLLSVITAIAVAMALSACGHEAPKQPEVKMQMTAPAQAPAKAPAAEPAAQPKPSAEGQAAAAGATTQE